MIFFQFFLIKRVFIFLVEDKCIIPKNYQIKWEKASIHEKLKWCFSFQELVIKYQKLSQYRLVQNKKYRESLKEYMENLKKFAEDKKEEINLERAK